MFGSLRGASAPHPSSVKNLWCLRLLVVLAATLAACASEDNDELAECSDTTPCPNGQFCNDNYVCEHEEGGACSDDAPCPSGQFCNDQEVCENEQGAECSASTPCPTGQSCNNDGVCEPSSSSNAEGIRLNDVVSEAPGVNCPYGGQALRTGIDSNENGTLDAEEVDGVSYICASSSNSGPSFLFDSESLPVGDGACPQGGLILHSGYDTNENGELDVDERQNSVTQCHNDACDDAEALIVETIEIEEDIFGQYDASETYEVRVQLNRAVDETTLQVQQYDEAFAPDAEFHWSVDPDAPHVIVIDFQPTTFANTQLTIADDCTLTTQALSLPQGNDAPLNVYAFSEDTPVVGDDIELCWTSRNAASCEIDQGTYQAPEVSALPSTEGCIDVEVRAEQIYNNSYYTGPAITCDDGDGGVYSYTFARYLDAGVHSFSNVGVNYGPSSGAGFQFRSETAGMESCELVTNDTRHPFPTNTEASAVYLTESGAVSLECIDAQDNVYRSQENMVTLVAVGRGLTYANAAVGSGADGALALTLSLSGQHIVEGTCSGTLTYGDDEVSFDAGAWEVMSPPNEFTGSINVSEVFETIAYDASLDGAVEITCTDGDFTQTITQAL